jgi:hypothetical protein
MMSTALVLVHFKVITHQFLLEDNIPNLVLPSWKRRGELRVEVPCSSAISCALPDLKINEELSRNVPSMGQTFLAIKLVGRY